MHSYRNPFLDGFFRIITHAGSLYFILPAAAILTLLLVYTAKHREIQFLLISLTLSTLLAHAAKLLFKRPRPDIHPPMVPMPIDWSFPSAHTAQIATICLCVSLIAFRHFPGVMPWIVFILSFTLITLVGISRMYLQVHHPTDVLAGFFMAVLVVVLVQALVKP